jgi:hypothetical protein
VVAPFQAIDTNKQQYTKSYEASYYLSSASSCSSGHLGMGNSAFFWYDLGERDSGTIW